MSEKKHRDRGDRLQAHRLRALILPAALFLVSACAQLAPQQAPDTLVGPTWQLVKFRGGDGKVMIPGDDTKYNLVFGQDGRVTARIDCNRGTGSYKTTGASQIEFGPMAITRAMCPPGSLHDHVVKQLPYIRSYVIKNGHLFLSLAADGGTYEFKPE